jgi:DNA-binding beta-propeller fold protein YncE
MQDRGSLIAMKMTLVLLFCAGLAAADPGAGYHVVARWKPGGEGGWDYLTVDPSAHRLYFGRSTRVQVLDTQSGRLLGEVPDTPGIHGVALVPALGRGFTSNGRDSSVHDLRPRDVQADHEVRVGRNPDAILYDPSTRRVFTMNAGSDDANRDRRGERQGGRTRRARRAAGVRGRRWQGIAVRQSRGL